MAEIVNTTLYLTPDNTRYFLATDDKCLPVSDFIIRTFGGAARRSRLSLLRYAMLLLLE
jgi:hypothetical protein